MRATQTLHDLGQSLWLDNVTRHLLRTDVLRRYIDEYRNQADVQPDDLRPRDQERQRLR